MISQDRKELNHRHEKAVGLLPKLFLVAGFGFPVLLVVITVRRNRQWSKRQKVIDEGTAVEFPSHAYFSSGDGWTGFVIFRSVGEFYLIEIFRSVEAAKKGDFVVPPKLITSKVRLPPGLHRLTVGPNIANGFQILESYSL